MPAYRRTFASLPEEIRAARDWTRKLLADASCAEDAALIVTELTTNAVVHTTGPVFRVTVARTAEAVTIAVTDTGGATAHPRVTHPDADATHGRGLEIVTHLAAAVAVHHDPGGHTVTATLLDPAPQPARPC